MTPCDGPAQFNRHTRKALPLGLSADLTRRSDLLAARNPTVWANSGASHHPRLPRAVRSRASCLPCLRKPVFKTDVDGADLESDRVISEVVLPAIHSKHDMRDPRRKTKALVAPVACEMARQLFGRLPVLLGIPMWESLPWRRPA